MKKLGEIGHCSLDAVGGHWWRDKRVSYMSPVGIGYPRGHGHKRDLLEDSDSRLAWFGAPSETTPTIGTRLADAIRIYCPACTFRACFSANYARACK